MNKITLIGNLTKDPETRTANTGNTICTFTIAVNRKKTADSITDFFRISTWNALADNCGKYLTKGKKVAVVGELQARMYDANNGQQRMSLDVIAEEVEFLSPKETANVPDRAPDQKPAWTPSNNRDLPF